jgi:hypothetical protein
MSGLRLCGTVLAAALCVGPLGLLSCAEPASNAPVENPAHAMATPVDPNCLLSQNAAAFKQVVLDNNGHVEPIHIDGGLAVLATAETPEGIERIREAARTNVAANESQAVPASVATNPQASACERLAAAVQAGTIQVSAADAENGALLLIVSSDTGLAETIQSDGCCNYCICPSHNARCTRCC